MSYRYTPAGSSHPSPTEAKIPKLRILGSLSLTAKNGKSCSPRALKLRILLANLLCGHNRAIPIEHLIRELWNESPPKTAKTALQVYVSNIRKVLDTTDLAPGYARIVTQPPGYMLEVDDNVLDLALFEQYWQEARNAQDTGRTKMASQLLSDALALWRGPALSDVCTTPDLQAEARRLNEMRQAARERKILLDLELGRHTEVISELYALTSRHPFHENLCAYLMIALQRQGRPADALDVYSELARALRNELGLDPGTQLQRLHQLILLREPIPIDSTFELLQLDRTA
ncbi:BTAD domain-containing putative transcriptional regulator [Micromonospora sp. NPDC007230]|uniref:AfsR/SARP family transcriptional regulator n=1 Tax=Micromonospora sp. NPDC007230 TaxID=3364237 RepID=UPI0036A16789